MEKKKKYNRDDLINFSNFTYNKNSIQRTEMKEKDVQTLAKTAELFPPRKYFNKAIQSFGIELSLLALHTFFLAYPGMPQVSVGSGNGVLEFCYAKKYTGSKETILCVDPAPLSYNSNGLESSFQAPKYDYVRDLLREKPQLRRNCVLVLNWPNPFGDPYDIDAVMSLEPCGFFTTLEHWRDTGAAGSPSFHHFLQTTQTYRLGHRIRLNKSEQDICIEWWHRSDLPPLPPQGLPVIVDSNLENKEMNLFGL